MEKPRLTIIAAAVLAVLSYSANTAAAQTTTETTKKTDNQKQNNDKKDDKDVEKITVKGSYTVSSVVDTATGLGLTLRETPQSVSVLTASRIRDQDMESVVDAVQNTVGLSSIAVDNVRNTMQARGFDITNYQIDGVPLSWSLGGDAGETIADVSIYKRIEVVRGSTGLLTGAGDPSASINLVRKHADSTDFTGYVSAGVGSWNKREVTTDLSSGLSQDGSLRGRFVGKYEDGDSFTDYYSNKKSVLYGVVEKDIDPNTLLRVGASYQDNKPKGAVWGGLPGVFSDGSTTNWDRATTTAAKWTRWETTSKNYFANLSHSFNNSWQAVFNYNYLKYTSDTKLLYLYPASDDDESEQDTVEGLDKDTGSGLTSYPYKSHGDSAQNSFDFQLKGQYDLLGREHDAVFGAIYSKQKAKTVSYDTDAYPDVDNFYDWDGNFTEPNWSSQASVEQDMDTVQKGYYAATRLNVTDELKVIAGGRLASWQRTGVSYDEVSDYGDDNVFIPYAGVLYDLTAQHRLYFSYTDIFMPQNAQDRNGDFLDPVTGKTYELGLKSTFFGDMLHTSVAVYRIEQDNLAQDDVEDGVTYYVPGSVNTVAQVGAKGTVSKGFELEVVGRPVAGWDISAGYSQFAAKDASDAEVNTDHPRKQFKLFTTYQFQQWLPSLTIGGGINWQSQTYTADVRQGAYSVVNLMARYEVMKNLDVQLNVNNLLDKTYYNYLDSSDEVRFGDPSNFALDLQYHF
ncbi:TonB-dependent siderophore receptor [Gallaecimonas mangrovi]|uniref:TonB-dependent siderophore receptor n=1 Tax=Gallaecimonas mangrovi TaxID=2291597 RepID=UPI000E1FBF2E|nr:TonB-dependent siderophore receptor [Gallaecimonas mangrovi]